MPSFNRVYKTIENVKATQSGEELLLDVLLEEAGVKLADVTVSANRSSNKGATDNALISFQKNTNSDSCFSALRKNGWLPSDSMQSSRR